MGVRGNDKQGRPEPAPPQPARLTVKGTLFLAVILVRHHFRNMLHVSCHCEECNDEAISLVIDCFGPDALAMTTIRHVIFLIANWYQYIAVARIFVRFVGMVTPTA
jgi:hypothetical protein